MNRDETRDLLLARKTAIGEPFAENEVAQWAYGLRDVPVGDAKRALAKLTEPDNNPTGTITLYDLKAALGRRAVNDGRAQAETCAACDGNGMTPAEVDSDGTIRYAPCPACRPQHPYNLAAGNTRNFADWDELRSRHALRRDPEHERRIDARGVWYDNGMHGHYPDCDCHRCAPIAPAIVVYPPAIEDANA